MMSKFVPLEIPEVTLIKPTEYKDKRGYFFELYKYSKFVNITNNFFIQDNVSKSKKNVLRGLHYQRQPFTQAKLITVFKGKIMDVAVDIRSNSSTYKQYVSVILDDKSKSILYIPKGFAHGFLTLSEEAIIFYKNTNEYSQKHEGGIIWDDPEINIEWPINNPILSQKDSQLPKLHNIENELLKFEQQNQNLDISE